MSLRIQLFGPLADAAGSRDIRVDAQGGTLSVAQVIDRIGQIELRLRPMLGSARLAVNCSFVGPEHVVRESDELALIGLVSGG